MSGTGFLVGAAVSLLAGLAGTVLLVRRAWTTRSTPAIKGFALVVGFLAVATDLAAAAGFVLSLGAVSGESVDPSQQARLVAEGLSEAINMAFWGFVLWVPSTLVLAWLVRAKPSARN